MSWFKNISLYRVPAFPLDAEGLAAALAKWEHQPCGAGKDKSAGFARIRDGEFVWSVEGEHFVAIRISRKVLPASVVRDEVERLALGLEKKQGFRPGKKQKKEIKEQATEDLLPKAFEVSRDVRIWISPKRGFVAIDTGSQGIADKLIGGFIRAVQEPFAITPAKYALAATRAMTQWIAGEPPSGFTVDADSTTFAAPEGNIKFSGVEPSEADTARQIEAGRYVSTLALTFDDKVSFVLTGANRITRIAPLGIIKASKKEAQDPDAHAADMLLMTGTLGELIEAVAESLDGYAAVEDLFAAPDTDAEAGADEDCEENELQAAMKTAMRAASFGENDPLLSEAQAIVLKENRASISFVQRHLRIGYNRAARLLELLEAAGVVSAMKSNGTRTITGQGAA